MPTTKTFTVTYEFEVGDYVVRRSDQTVQRVTGQGAMITNFSSSSDDGTLTACIRPAYSVGDSKVYDVSAFRKLNKKELAMMSEISNNADIAS